MTIHLITTDHALLEKLAEQVDIAEGYHESVRRPGHITERHAEIESHPDGLTFAYIHDETVLKYRDLIAGELEKEGLDKEAVLNQLEAIKDGTSVKEETMVKGIKIEWTEKDESWDSDKSEVGEIGSEGTEVDGLTQRSL